MTAGEATREFYRQQGRKQEQERIIKLVQDEYALVSSRNGYQFLPEQIDWLVALIKGEK